MPLSMDEAIRRCDKVASKKVQFNPNAQTRINASAREQSVLIY